MINTLYSFFAGVFKINVKCCFYIIRAINFFVHNLFKFANIFEPQQVLIILGP